MYIYLINIFLIILLGIVFIPKGYNKLYNIIITLQWVLLSGLRHWSIGPDTYTYYFSFIRVNNTSWTKLFQQFVDILYYGASGKDPGYNIFVKVFQLFSNNYQIFLVFIALIFTIPLGIWIYKYSKNPIISWLIYSVLFYAFFAITGHRQTIATGLVVFLGYELIRKRKLLFFILLTLLAATIHKSALMFFPFYWCYNIKIFESMKIVYIVIVISLFAFSKQFSATLKFFFGYDNYGVNSEAGTWVFSSIFILIFIVMLFFMKRMLEKNKDSRQYINATYIALFLLPLTFVNPSAMRVVQYYSVFIMLLIPEIINLFKNNSRIFSYSFLGFFLLVLFFKTQPKYMFFWQQIGAL